jgi:hypothetical protein
MAAPDCGNSGAMHLGFNPLWVQSAENEKHGLFVHSSLWIEKEGLPSEDESEPFPVLF